MNIRAANESDAEAISALVTALVRRHVHTDCTPRGLQRLLATMTPAAVLERMAGDYMHWVAMQDENLAGVCVLREKTHLYHLFVADAFQRQRIGQRMVDAAIAYSRTHAPSLDVLTVNASSFGIPAYARMGFVLDGAAVEANGIRHQPMRLALGSRQPAR